MFAQFVFDGTKERTSAKGSPYAEIYVRGVNEDGAPDFVQKKFMTFDENVIMKLRKYSKDDLVNLELEIRDATVTDVGVN